MCIPFHSAFFFLLIRFINSFISCSPLSDHLRDLVSRLLPEEKGKVSLIVDGCSPVAGYEAAAQECIKDMAAEGVNCVSFAEVEMAFKKRLARVEELRETAEQLATEQAHEQQEGSTVPTRWTEEGSEVNRQ